MRELERGPDDPYVKGQHTQPGGETRRRTHLEPGLVRIIWEIPQLRQPILGVLVSTGVNGANVTHCVRLDRHSERGARVFAFVLQGLLGL